MVPAGELGYLVGRFMTKELFSEQKGSFDSSELRVHNCKTSPSPKVSSTEHPGTV